MDKRKDTLFWERLDKDLAEYQTEEEKIDYGIWLARQYIDEDKDYESAQKVCAKVGLLPNLGFTSLSQEVDIYIEQSGGRWFDRDEIVREFCLNKEPDLRNLSTILHRRWKEEVVEKHPRINKRYRKIEKDLLETDWRKASGKSLKILYPFDLHKFYKTLPKSIMVIAGYPNSGKSAWFYDFIKMNQKMYPGKIHYFNSDCSDDELKSRLIMHEDVGLDEWGFHNYERAANWSDVIRPNEINLIDYMSVHEEFYLIGKWIEQVWEKLDRGIAIIAIQKESHKKTELGRGGLGTLEKPRLYMTMEFDRTKQCGIARIVKQKTRKNGLNYNGYKLEYKIYDGWRTEWREWHPEY